jgi:hypothetical protein
MSCEPMRESLVALLGDPGDPLQPDLQAHLEGCAACREELARMRQTWVALGSLGEASSSERMRGRFFAMLAAESAAADAPVPVAAPRRAAREPVAWWSLRPALPAGLVAAGLLAGVGLGAWIGSRQAGQAEIEQLRAEMRTMTHLATLSLLGHQSASERLRAIGLSETTPPDEELAQALLRVVNEDPSANVRLAALDALASMSSLPEVRAGLFASFPRQESPAVTAALASLLLEVDGSDAVAVVRAAAADERLPDSLRRYLRTLLAERGRKRGAGA